MCAWVCFDSFVSQPVHCDVHCVLIILHGCNRNLLVSNTCQSLNCASRLPTQTFAQSVAAQEIFANETANAARPHLAAMGYVGKVRTSQTTGHRHVCTLSSNIAWFKCAFIA